ncbi:MAG: MotA/TolQ/ExbB proton channel family protein [Planctomycetaceae bacterium]|nr:MotA/TolQ/ExbB proton channel family protein [Planctomycetaceae bacterium]
MVSIPSTTSLSVSGRPAGAGRLVAVAPARRLYWILATGIALSYSPIVLAQGAETAAADTATTAAEPDLPTTIIELFRALDVWTIPFAALTIIAVWVAADRIVVLRRGRVIPIPFVKRFLRLLEAGELDPAEALQICVDNDSPVAHVFAHGIRKWGKPSVEVEQAIIDGGERQVSGLRKHLRVLNGVATISPLLGLLGTVWGMLGAFRDVASKTSAGGMEQLGTDIALALATTAAGLIIAIPALSVYMYLTARIDSLVMEMDDLSQKVVHCVSAEALADRSARPRRTKPAATEKPAEEPQPKKKAV